MGLLSYFKDKKQEEWNNNPNNPMNIANEYNRILTQSKHLSPQETGTLDPQRADPLEQWRKQVHSMLSSSNTEVRKLGEKQYGDLQKAIQEGSGSGAEPTTLQKNLMAAGLTPGTDKFKSTLMDKVMQGSFAEQRAPLGTTLEDPSTGEKIDASYMPAKEIYNRKLRFKKPQSADSAGKQAMLESADRLYDVAHAHIFNDDGTVNRDILNAATVMNVDPTSGKWFAKQGLKKLGNYSEETIEEASRALNALTTGMFAITRTETGAAMAKEEVAHTAQRFMPVSGESDALVKQKMDAYKWFIQNAINLISPEVRQGGDAQALAAEVQLAADMALARVKDKGPKKFTETDSSGRTWTYEEADDGWVPPGE